jgi:hypothetical protein
MRKLLFSAVAAAAIGGLAPITSAPAVAAVCPLVGVDSDCQTLITLNAGNIVGITNGLNHGPYDIVEDTLLGVVNNTGGTVFSLNLIWQRDFWFRRRRRLHVHRLRRNVLWHRSIARHN